MLCLIRVCTNERKSMKLLELIDQLSHIYNDTDDNMEVELVKCQQNH
jgi:hypothetical protein